MQPREWIEPDHLRPTAETLAARWHIEGGLEFVRNFTNLVYRHRNGGATRYLRITPKTHRTPEQILSELDFIGALSGAGIDVAEPVPSGSGELVHSIEHDGAEYVGCVFEEAPGLEFGERFGNAPPSREFFNDAGRAMGRLHSMTHSYARPECGDSGRSFASLMEREYVFCHVPGMASRRSSVTANRRRAEPDLSRMKPAWIITVERSRSI